MAGDGVRALDGQDVGAAWDHDQLGVGDSGAYVLHHGDGGGRVVGAGEDQGGGGDGGDGRAQVHGGDGPAARGVAVRVHRHEAVPQRRGLRGVGGGEGRRQPARHHRVGDAGHAVSDDAGGTLLPVAGQVGGRGHERQADDPAGVADGQGLRRHAAQGQPGHMGAGNAQRVQQAREVVGQVVDGRGAGGRVGPAVPARVVAQHLVASGQAARHGVPHLQRRADGVGQGHHRGAGGAGQVVEQADAVGGDVRHGPGSLVRWPRASPVCAAGSSG